jgi:hypothetical protein
MFTCCMMRSTSQNTFNPFSPISLDEFNLNIKASYSAMLLVVLKSSLKDKCIVSFEGEIKTLCKIPDI